MPPGLRCARIVAADLRPGDLLHHGGEWLPVASVAELGRMRELKLVGVTDTVRLFEAEPVLIRWQVPATTAGLAADLRRGEAQ